MKILPGISQIYPFRAQNTYLIFAVSFQLEASICLAVNELADVIYANRRFLVDNPQFGYYSTLYGYE